MQLRVVDGNHREPHRQSTLISYVINDHVAIDAGALGILQPLERQRKIDAVFLSHSHADHVCTLPLFVDNVYEPGPGCVTVYARQSTIDDLQRHVFNDCIWPDVGRLAKAEHPFAEFIPIELHQAVQLADVKVTAFEADHTIPTFSYLIEDGHVAVAIVSDTTNHAPIWEFLNRVENLVAVFLEISFPNSMQWLAERSKHLTPSDFVTEVALLRRPVKLFITHVKPAFAEAISEEVAAMNMDNCEFVEAGRDYRF